MKKPLLREKKNKNKNKTLTDMSYSMTHYLTAIFGSQKPLGTTDWTCNLVNWSKTACGSHECVVVEHTAQTIFIYASKTLYAELD